MTQENKPENSSSFPSRRKSDNIYPKTIHFVRVIPGNTKYVVTTKDLEYVRSIVRRHIDDRPDMSSEDMAKRVRDLKLTLPSRHRVSLIHTPIVLYGPTVSMTKPKDMVAKDMEIVRKSIISFVHSKTEGIFLLNGAIDVIQQGAS